MPDDKDPTRKPGPGPDRLKVEREDWEGAVRDALKKKRPAEGWPRPPKSKRRKK